jgi:hypothetical protein
MRRNRSRKILRRAKRSRSTLTGNARLPGWVFGVLYELDGQWGSAPLHVLVGRPGRLLIQRARETWLMAIIPSRTRAFARLAR